MRKGLKGMKILIITNHSYMLYRFRRELIESLMEEHEVVLSMPFVGHEDDFLAMGLKCIETEIDRRGIDPQKDLKLFRFYRRMLRQERPDLVVTYSIKPNLYAGMACTMAGIPFCANVQGLGTAFQRKPIAAIVTGMYKVAMRKARTVFFENEVNAREFVRRHIVPAGQETILPGAGINLERYPLRAYPENDRFHFLYLGRIMDEKGISELLSAACRLHTELGDRVVLDVVGFCEDDYLDRLRRLERDGILIFHGFRDVPDPYYAQTDCVVLPSYHEGMSNVLLEAAATGRPVIASDISGCREAVDPDRSGLLCRPRDTESLYTQMLRMAQLSREERMEMGIAGRTKMECEFDKNMVVQRTMDAMFRTKM